VKGRDHLEELGVDGDLKEIRLESVVWMHLPQDRNHRWALVKTVMNFQVP
jgi:hypothetical protein